jgi:hypothetical protein
MLQQRKNMKLSHTALFIALLGSTLFANSDRTQNITDFTKKVGGIESPTCITCSSVTSTTATVQKIDKKTREITFKNEAGNVTIFKAPPDVKNFNQLNVGDVAVMTITVDADIQVTRGALETKTRTIKESLTKAKLGSKPGVKLHTVTVDQAKIIDLDYKTKSVTLESMHGMLTITPRDVEQFRILRVGDIVDAISSKTVEINVVDPLASGK